MTRGWDKGLDYQVAYNRIVRHMRISKQPALCYDAILLTQLRNGSRISEAVRAFKEFLRSGAVEIQVKLSKRRDGATRLMIIPVEVDRQVREACRELLGLDEKTLKERVRVYAYHTYNWNTHSLRYAFITHLLRLGVESAIISKITGHKNLNYIITYTQRKTAEDILRSL
jgi:integrase